MAVLSLYRVLKLGLSFKLNTRVGNREEFLFSLIPFCKKNTGTGSFMTFGSVSGSADVDKTELK